jgi:hypothetical protein
MFIRIYTRRRVKKSQREREKIKLFPVPTVGIL